jgi:hypothetical protein
VTRRAATLLFGLGQAIVAGLAGLAWFQAFRLEYYGATEAARSSADNPFAYGALLWLSFLASWRGALASFFFAEGVVRAVHATVTGEPLGTTVGWLVRAAVRRWRRARAPEERDDRLAREGARLILETDRRRDWDSMTTIAHGEAFYVVERLEALPDGPRRLRYTLAPPSPRHLIRGLVQLDGAIEGAREGGP